MSLVDYRKRRMTTFRGWRSQVDETDINVPFALNARNVRYKPGEVGTRPGHSPVFTPSGPITSMHHWVTSIFNLLVFFEGGQYAKIRHPGGTFTDLFTQSGYGISVGELGKRAAIATFNSSGLGAGQCRVVDLTTYPGMVANKAFMGPMSYSPTIVEAGSGGVTAGTHRFGYIAASRTGFIGQPSPVVGGSFTPVEFTVGEGGKALFMQFLNTPWPADAYAIYPIMTTANNPDQWYFIPNAEFLVPGGNPFSYSAQINIADTSLIFNQADLDANDQFELLTQDASGNGPFHPSVVIPYGDRMVYVVDETLYISEPSNYQQITSDQHTKVLPGRLRMITGFVIGSTLYVLGPHWTYSFSDNGDVPATWAKAREVDGKIGALGPTAVTARSSKGYGWVADEAGLFHFSGGVYDDIPISYYNTPEWNRINRAAAHTIKVVDNYKEQYVEVYAPLDDATVPNYILRWSYLRGKTAENVDFSMDQIAGPTGTIYSIGSAAIVEDPATKKLARWLGPGVAGGKVLREDEAVHTDDGNEFSSIWRSPPFPLDEDRATEQNVLHAYALRAKGSGTMLLKSYTLGASTGEPLVPIALSENPSRDELRRMHHLLQQESLEISTNSGWWKLSRLTPYWSDWGNP